MTNILDNKRLIWLTFIGIAIATLTLYVLTSLDAGQGNLLMPLDDVYIHFQYARQMALGHPYQYNLIDPATSGATSLIYPYILALGYLIGFKGLWLGLWAMIVGTIALIASLWAVYHLCKAFNVTQWLSLLTAIIFGLTGSVAWHFMSGMETGIVITLMLFTLLFVVEKRLTPFLIVATLLTLTRPESGLVAAIAAATLFLRLWTDFGAHEKRPAKRKYLLLLMIPILAIGIQPLVNLLITGTTVATGAQAKSILATVPQDTLLIIGRIWDNFSRMWLEFVTGYDGREGRGWYLPIFTGLLGLLAIPMLIFKKDYRLVGLMLLGWFLVLTAAISTLDNAFWHFKRYQMPMLALFFPLAAWVLATALNRFPKIRFLVYGFEGIVIPVFVIILLAQFQHYHAVNVSYVYQQPYQMAIWLRDNTPEDALIAVHDVGLMRYLGERSTLDMVGLTTPNAAVYWRNGPGSIAEFLINEQPDYIASYGRGHGYGLAYLADTSLYANQLADFTIPDWQPHLNVALAADSQGIYQPNWQIVIYGFSEYPKPLNLRQECSGGQYFTFMSDEDHQQLPFLNVADIDSELDYNYVWYSQVTTGFATEVREFDTIVSAYRIIDGFEEFSLNLVPHDGRPMVLYSALHASSAGTIDIFVDDILIATRWIPEIVGQQVIVPTLLNPEILHDDMQIRIVPHIENGFYMPACHFVRPYYEATTIDTYPFTMERLMNIPSIADYQDGVFYLAEFTQLFNRYNDRQLAIDLDFFTPSGEAWGDYRLFVHLYNEVNQPPIVQWDGYVGLPGNWLPGYRTDPYIDLDLTDIPSGTYQLAIGFYNPNDPTDRLIPESDIYDVTADGRLWLGEVEIE